MLLKELLLDLLSAKRIECDFDALMKMKESNGEIRPRSMTAAKRADQYGEWPNQTIARWRSAAIDLVLARGEKPTIELLCRAVAEQREADALRLSVDVKTLPPLPTRAANGKWLRYRKNK